MNDNLNMYETADAWADIVLTIWEEQIKNYELTDTNYLVQSLDQHVNLHSNGNPDRIDFFYKYYGKFADMGVGNGVNLNNQEALLAMKKIDRKPKPWFTDTFFYQVRVLGEIMAKKYAEKAAISIVKNIDDNAERHGKRWEKIKN
jgi:hypothetical protein